MATRNFYDTRSVAAFLLSSLQTGDTTNARFAAAELAHSGLRPLVDQVATLALLLAPPRYGFLAVEDRLAAALSLPPFELPTLLPPLPPPTKATKKTCSWNPGNPMAATIWWAVHDAVKKGRVERAAALTVSSKIGGEAVLSLLLSLEKDGRWLSFVPSGPLGRALLHAYANPTLLPEPQSINFLDSGRAFSIPSAVLTQWCVPVAPLSLCVGAPVWILGPDASPFWQTLVTKHGISGKGCGTYLEGRNDEATEAFYTEGFPQDIPDEWSQAERRKSHGPEETATQIQSNPWAPCFPT